MVLKLSKNGFWEEIDALMQSQDLPRLLGLSLKGLVSAVLHNTARPQIQAFVVRLYCEILTDKIMIGDRLYEVVFHVPDDPTKNVILVDLVPAYTGNHVRSVHDMAKELGVG